jgi:hypothetical protein
MMSKIFSVVLFILGSITHAQIAMGDCTKLDDKKLENLLISGSTAVLPGATIRPRTFVRECCVIDTDVHDLCATWSMDAVDGVHLDSKTGELAIDKSVAAGTKFNVTANVQNGSRILTSKIAVFTPEQNPFVGTWIESAQIDCETGELVSPEVVIKEIEFRADGQFFVTWLPFEVYRDYWGTYSFDLKKGVFTLSDLSGNYVPKDVDDGGTFVFQSNKSLVLKNFWFGTQIIDKSKVVKKACGHHLFR